MGKIKPYKSLRNKAKEIVERNPKDFLNFENNKEFVRQHFPEMSKRMQNVLAGYLVREAKKRCL